MIVRIPVVRGRSGFSLVELTVTMTIGGLLCVILAAALSGTQRLTRLQGERVAAAEARRVAASILAAELRYLEPGTDLRILDRDSLALRAFRGSAVSCASKGGGTLVRYRGLRAPEPAKDSVVSVGEMRGAGGAVSAGGSGGPGGATVARPLLASAVAATGCSLLPGESLYHWELDPPPPPGTLLLLFESGSYHLTAHALRYRRGESGRQPLTAELLEDQSVPWRWIELAGGSGCAAESGGAAREASSRVAIELFLATKSPGGSPDAPVSRHWLAIRR